MILSSGDGYVGEPFELHQGFQKPDRGSRGKVGFPLRHRSGKGPHLTLRGESPGLSGVIAGNVGFLPSCDRDHWKWLLWPQESPVSVRVMRGLSGFLSSLCRVLGHHLRLKPQTQGSSPVLSILGFLGSFHREVRPRLVWRHASLLS